MANELKRFWDKVEKTDNCWTWKATINTCGYGQFWASGRIIRAHRYSWQLVNEQIPEGMQLDHTCHNRACVNPEHLRVTTRKENNENRLGAHANNRSGVRGVTRRNEHSKWQATVRHHGYLHYVGTFEQLADAEAAVIAKRNELFTHNDADRTAA